MITKRYCMTNERLKYLLDRYLDNTATPEELQEYDNWYEQQAGAGEEEVFDRAEQRDLYKNILRRIDTPPAVKWYAPYINWAAAALVAGILFLLYNTIKTEPAAPLAGNKPLQDTLQQELVSIDNPGSEQKQVRLKDGSLVTLYAGSVLTYWKQFNKRDRNVYLSGKGYFDVAKDPDRPFKVYSHGVTTTALGTAFTITAWPAQSEVKVLLHKGRVVVRDSAAGRREVYLMPGQQLSCKLTAGSVKFQPLTDANGDAIEMNNAALALSRSGFAASFDQEPLDTVLDLIAKGYGVQLQYDRTKMSAMIFSGSIRETDSLAQVLNRIGVLYNLSVKPAGKQIIIRKSH
jgi:ferric-dicitrate binding protein FerR (iron transport regulator)